MLWVLSICGDSFCGSTVDEFVPTAQSNWETRRRALDVESDRSFAARICTGLLERENIHAAESSLSQKKKKNPTRCNTVSKFYYSIFIRSSTCFGRHTTHHQEPKTALAVSGFSFVEGCGTCSWWTLSGTYRAHTVPDKVHQLHVPQPSTNEKQEDASAVLGSWWWAVCRPKHVELHINME